MKHTSNTTNLNVRVDATLKKESDLLFKNLGLNMSTAINMFLTKCVNTSSIPFEISSPKPNKNLKKAIKEAKNISNGKVSSKGYHNVHEMFEDILNED